MKEFVMKHPILTFLLVGSAIDGIVKIVAWTSAMHIAKNLPDEEAEEATEDESESSNDIQ